MLASSGVPCSLTGKHSQAEVARGTGRPLRAATACRQALEPRLPIIGEVYDGSFSMASGPCPGVLVIALSSTNHVLRWQAGSPRVDRRVGGVVRTDTWAMIVVTGAAPTTSSARPGHPVPSSAGRARVHLPRPHQPKDNITPRRPPRGKS